MSKKTQKRPPGNKPAGVALVDPDRLPELLARIQNSRPAGPGGKVERRWYVVTVPLAHRRLGSERMGWVLAYADSEATAMEMTREPKLAPGMQRDRIQSVRLASPSDLTWLRNIPKDRLGVRRAWTCWELAETTAEEF